MWSSINGFGDVGNNIFSNSIYIVFMLCNFWPWKRNDSPCWNGDMLIIFLKSNNGTEQFSFLPTLRIITQNRYINKIKQNPIFLFKRRSLAVGICLSGVSCGKIVMPYLGDTLLELCGWQWAFRIYSICFIVIR